MKTPVRFVALLLLLLLPFGGAAAAQDETPTLRMGLLPVLDTLPFYIAQQNGYFEEVGIVVEGIPVASPVQRDELLQAGEVDGVLNEMTTTALFNREETQLQIVAVARIPYENAPVFRVLAAPGSSATSPADLAGVPVAVSPNTIIEYTTFRMLQQAGLTAEQIVFQPVPAIPERFQLLMQGQIPAATLPDPLAQAAVEAGAVPIIDDSAYADYSVSTLSFRTTYIEEQPTAVAAFLAAWTRAVEDLNADPDAYRGVFLENVNVPPAIQETYVIPPFPVAQLPTPDQWDDVMDWLVFKELLDAPVAYEASVNPAFLPVIEMEATPDATETGG